MKRAKKVDFYKLESKSLNHLIQNFCESLIMLDAYPRCQVNIHLNILNTKDEAMVKFIKLVSPDDSEWYNVRLEHLGNRFENFRAVNGF